MTSVPGSAPAKNSEQVSINRVHCFRVNNGKPELDPKWLIGSQPTVLFPWPMLRGNSCTQLAHCFIRRPNFPVGRVPPSHFHKQRFWIGSVRQPSTNFSGSVVGSALLLQTTDIIGKSLRYEATDPIRLPMLPSQARSSINPGTGRVHLSARRRRRFRHNQRDVSATAISYFFWDS